MSYSPSRKLRMLSNIKTVPSVNVDGVMPLHTVKTSYLLRQVCLERNDVTTVSQVLQNCSCVNFDFPLSFFPIFCLPPSLYPFVSHMFLRQLRFSWYLQLRVLFLAIRILHLLIINDVSCLDWYHQYVIATQQWFSRSMS